MMRSPPRAGLKINDSDSLRHQSLPTIDLPADSPL
jgi:hypothetical protein